MKVLQINNYGYVRGGSDRYFLDLSDLLLNRGHQVSYLVSASSKNKVDAPFAVQGFNVASPSLLDVPKFVYSRDAARQLRLLIEKERPDVAHLHIYYGQITASILPVLKKYGIPMVQTLHEYKLLCPIATMMRQGSVCVACAKGGYWRAAWNRCNRGSLARSLATSVESYVSTLCGASTSIDHFIAVSDFLKYKMILHGIPPNRITRVYNFVRDEEYAENHDEGSYFLYFGRVEKVKGLETLIKAMSAIPSVDLYVVGSGNAREDLEEMVIRMGLTNVKFMGFQTGKKLRNLISGAICVVNPSECFETFGLVLVESFAQCRPVIASRIGGMSEVVSDGEDGLLFEAGNVEELRAALCWMAANKRRAVEMGKAGQAKVKKMFSAEKHYQEIMQVYEKVVRA